MKNFVKGLWLRLKTAIKPFVRVQMIISCFIPFCVVTLPAYVLPVIGLITHNAVITAVGTTWLGIIHLPICHESIIIIPIGLFIHTKLFPKDKITRYRLLRLLVQAKRDVKAVKERLKRLTKKGSGGIMTEKLTYEQPKFEVVEPKVGNLGLPFGLCKKYGIAIEDNWTPRDAWDALKDRLGVDPEDVYKELENSKITERKPEKASEEEPKQIKQVYSKKVEKIFSDFRKNRAKLRHEESIVCDNDGNLLCDLKGKTGSVSFSAHYIDQFKDKHLIHNHPQVNTFLSAGDVDILMTTELSSVEAIGFDGTICVIKKGENLSRRDMMDFYTGYANAISVGAKKAKAAFLEALKGNTKLIKSGRFNIKVPQDWDLYRDGVSPRDLANYPKYTKIVQDEVKVFLKNSKGKYDVQAFIEKE